MTMNRRSVMGTLVGAAAVPFGDALMRAGETGSSTIPVSSASAMLAALRTALNTARAEELCATWCVPDVRLLAWNDSADAGRDGPAGINALLKDLRDRLGKIEEPVAAGQFLVSPDGRSIRYYPQFDREGQMLGLEIMLLLERAPAVLKLRELRFADPGRFNTTATHTVDVPADGRSDVSAAVQTAYDALVRSGGGTLQFPPGSFRLSLILGSRNVQLRGAGRLATHLIATDPNAVVLRGAYRSGTWDAVTVSDLSITGGERLVGIGFRAGDDAGAKDDEFVGRTRFENVRFVNLDTCIDRPRGQIGLIVDACQFEDARVHLAAQAREQAGRPLMHAGNILVRGSHFQQAREAVVQLDSVVTGSGQITFQDCIMESNPGIVFDIRNLNAVDSVPAMTVSRCWNEQNATAATVTVGDKAEKPVYARLTNCSLIRFEDTPVGSLILRNSVVRTLDCSLDQLKVISRDDTSLIEHMRARMFSGVTPAGQVDSVEATYLNAPGRGVSFILPHRSGLSRGYREAVKMSIMADSPIGFTGTANAASSPVDDAVLPGQAIGQQLLLNPESEIFPQPVALSRGQWVAWLYAYRHLAGSVPTLSLTGSHGLTLETPLDSPAWRTLGGMTFVPADAPSVSFWHRCAAQPATIHIGGMNLLSFDTRQAARDFLNSGMFAG